MRALAHSAADGRMAKWQQLAAGRVGQRLWTALGWIRNELSGS